MNFDWTNATDEELARHIASVPACNTTRILRYYEKLGNEELVGQIQKARQKAKTWRILLKAEKLGAIIPSTD